MNYKEIRSTALLYADRKDDQELVADQFAAIQSFMRIVETRVQRFLQTRHQSKRAYITTSLDKEVYSLPCDFSGLRTIGLKANLASPVYMTLEYATPLDMTWNNSADQVYYTIIGNTLQLSHQIDSKILEIVYYQDIPKLTNDEDTNWVSIKYPDVLIFGLLVEINSFAKDPEAATLWDGRFQSALNDIEFEDQKDRWSGTPLVIRSV